jgi:hypothetical protein
VDAWARGLKLDDAQAGNAAKVANVAGPDRVAQLQRTCSDDEERERALSPPPKLTAHVRQFRRAGAINAVGEFRYGQRTDHDGHVAGRLADLPDNLGRGEFLSLGRD